MKQIFNILLGVFILSHFSLNANTAALKQANAAYIKNDFKQAITLYNQVLQSGYESADLYYNLGNAYFKNKENASAILCYERALRLNPGNSDIHHNLEVARSLITDKIESVPQLMFSNWWNALTGKFSLRTLAILTLIILLITLTFFSMYFLFLKTIHRKIAFWGGALTGLVFIIMMIAAFNKQLNIKKANQAIIMSAVVNVKSSPDEMSADIFVIHEGTKVELLDSINSWNEIRIANGSVGWVHKETFQRI